MYIWLHKLAVHFVFKWLALAVTHACQFCQAANLKSVHVFSYHQLVRMTRPAKGPQRPKQVPTIQASPRQHGSKPATGEKAELSAEVMRHGHAAALQAALTGLVYIRGLLNLKCWRLVAHHIDKGAGGHWRHVGHLMLVTFRIYNTGTTQWATDNPCIKRYRRLERPPHVIDRGGWPRATHCLVVCCPMLLVILINHAATRAVLVQVSSIHPSHPKGLQAGDIWA